MYENPGKCISLKAPAAITGKYLPVKMTSTGIAVLASGTEGFVGFVQREGIANEVLPVMTDGITMGVASEAIAKGDYVTPTTGGALAVADVGDGYIGIALEAATAANDIIPVLIQLGALASE